MKLLPVSLDVLLPRAKASQANVFESLPWCGIEKDLSAFSIHRDRPDGLNAVCRECHRIYYLKNKEHIRAAHREYYQENEDAIKAASRRYYVKHKEAILLAQQVRNAKKNAARCLTA
jgi:hypothetical protein